MFNVYHNEGCKHKQILVVESSVSRWRLLREKSCQRE